MRGLPAKNDPSVYSFDVFDALLALASSTFRNLTSIVAAGHSAGAQAMQRYAASTRLRIPGLEVINLQALHIAHSLFAIHKNMSRYEFDAE